MKFSINNLNIKVFYRALQYLARIGDEIHFESFASGLCLTTVNSRKTAYGTIKFEVEFFTEYEDDLGKKDETQCNISIKYILPLFRSLRTMESCFIRLDPKSCKLVVQFNCRQKISKTHSVPVFDFSRLDEIILPETFSNKITGSHKIMKDIIRNFHKTAREISFDVKKDSITIQNHIDNEDIDQETIRSKYSLRIDEFDTFSIKENCNIAFSHADFRAFVHFAQASEAFVRISFEAPGEPLCMSCQDQGVFVANLIVATILHDMEETGKDPVISDNTPSQNSNAVGKGQKSGRLKNRRQRVIDTQEDENPFDFMNKQVPQSVRNQTSIVSNPPSIIPETPSSSSSNSPSSLMSCPVVPLIDSTNIPAIKQTNNKDEQKQSEDIFFETEESEPNKNKDCNNIGEDMIIPETVETDMSDSEAINQITPQIQRRKGIFVKTEIIDKWAVPGADEILASDSEGEGDKLMSKRQLEFFRAEDNKRRRFL